MRAKKGRGAKVLPDESQTASSCDAMGSPNLSSIDKASFLEGLQLNHGNPLHSTAMEEDLHVLEEGEMHKGKTGRKGIPEKLMTTAKQHGAAMKRKETETDKKNVKEGKKKKSRSAGEKVKARPVKGGERKKKKGEPEEEKTKTDDGTIFQTSNQPSPKRTSLKHLVGKKPAKRRNAGTKSVQGWMKKDMKRKSESSHGRFSDSQSQEDYDTDTDQQSRSRVLSSDEEVDNDSSWAQSPKRPRVNHFGRTRKSSSGSKSRKSSSGSASVEAEKASSDKWRRERRGHQGRTDLDVVLDAFLDFCDDYRESVESKAVKQSINSFSSNVKEQLLEKISSFKELRVLKRENAKVGSLTRKKTQRLLDAKHELMRAERQVWLLQKEKAELKLRFADLKQSRALLHDIRELNQQYLDHRQKHPTEKETYGASSLSALLLETKHILTTENQLRGINNQIEKRLRKNETCK